MILSGARRGVYARVPPEQDFRTVITRLRHFSVWVRETIRHEGYLILAWRIFVSPPILLIFRFTTSIAKSAFARSKISSPSMFSSSTNG